MLNVRHVQQRHAIYKDNIHSLSDPIEILQNYRWKHRGNFKLDRTNNILSIANIRGVKYFLNGQ